MGVKPHLTRRNLLTAKGMESKVSAMPRLDPSHEKCVWTVGHSVRGERELLSLLGEHGIRYVADVRRFPGSRRHPQFSRENLESLFPEEGIIYLSMGRELGGFRKEGFERYMESSGFREGIDRLIGAAERGPTAVLCAEALYFRCHRRHIADELLRRGWRVIHILAEGRSVAHETSALQATLPL